MLTVSFVLTALAIAVVLGAGITAYLWRVRRHQVEVSTGIKALGAMRWREFSQFVVEALRAQGFAPGRSEPAVGDGQQADLMLHRGDKTWLLSCKQGADSVVAATQVGELAKGVREAGAGGGILATLGKIDPAARLRHQDIELVDGVSLWAIIAPLLPQSLNQEVTRRAHADTVRNTGLGWLVALLLGFAFAMVLASFAPVAPPVAAAIEGEPGGIVATRAPAVAGPAPPVLPIERIDAAPVSGDLEQQREQVMRQIASLPGFQRAMWSSRSTLVVTLQDEVVSARDIAVLCKTLEQFDELRASRLQLQPPAGSDKPVRFMQCHVY